MRPLLALIPFATGFAGCPTTDPKVDPPEAAAEVSCLDEACASIELSAAESLGADAWTWTVDGVFMGDEETLQMEPAEGLSTIEVEVSNDAGSDVARLFFVRTKLEPDPPTSGVDPAWSSVVAGATACNQVAVVATIGGCFTSPPVLRHVVLRTGSGGSSTSVLEYDKSARDVTAYAGAEGAAWRDNAAGTGLQFGPPGGPVRANNYGPFRRYPNVVGRNQSQLTSFYDLPTGDTLAFQQSHLAYLEDPAFIPADAIQFDCSTGELDVHLVPATPE